MSDGNKVIRSTVIAGLTALTLIGLLSLSGYYVLTDQIRQQAKYADMLSLCAHQRVNTQRATLLGFSLVSAHDANVRTRLRDELAELGASIELTHKALADEKGTREVSPTIRELFTAPPTRLTEGVKRFRDEINALVAEPDERLSMDNPHLYYIASASTDLMRKLELLTEQFRFEGQYGVFQLQRYHEVILIITVLLLGVTALLIFRPMIQRLRTELQYRAAVAHELERSSLALEERSLQLARTNKELEDFAGVVAHDLRAPLQNIVLGLDTLKRHLKEERGTEAEDLVETSQAAARRMDRLISELIRYSRAAAGISPLSPVSLTDVVSEVLDDLSALIGKEKAEVRRSELPVVHADRVQMHQVFQSLIENAIKYRHPDRPPVISIYSAALMLNDRVHQQIVVADNGIGFDGSQSYKMFRMFARLHPSSGSSGLGIGLATCERIIRRHNGTISAEGKVGQGSKFIITLPEA